MRSGTCKRTRGGGCLCKTKGGKVKFASKSRCGGKRKSSKRRRK